jgi:hypothetical protein
MNEAAEKDRSDYQREYYLKRKDTLSQERKDKYRSDPSYREKAIAQARRYRREKREERERLRAEGKLPPAKSGGPRKPTEVDIGGRKVLAYTITIAAQRLGKSKSTLNNWTRQGVLPVTPLRTEGGDRLYTEGMIMVMKLAISKRVRISVKDNTFYQEVVDGWRELGVNVD